MRSLLVILFLSTIICHGVLAEPACPDIHVFLRDYIKILTQLPELSYPVFSLCTNKTVERHFMDAKSMYQNVSKEPQCQKYLDHNRMNVFGTVYSQMTDLWSKANCDACINAPNVTAEFMDLSNNLTTCLNVNLADPCASCDDDYQRVQQYYGRMREPDRLCFDIEDRMNQSRRAWSVQYKCCKDKKHSTVAFFSIASVACAMPVAFYLAMHLVRLRADSRRLTLTVDDGPRPVTAPHRSEPVLPSSNQHRAAADVDDETENSSLEDNDTAASGSGAMNNLNRTEGDLVSFLDSERDQSFNNLPVPEKVVVKRDLLCDDVDDNDDEAILS
ncbi:uncharacterized protein LOC131290511 [Anopheles ziemanni]|uniref:uncharacterized protein LOC131269159 n=1 Tax=Anopheles coustani TaxID=139045 RepID=UPI0026591F57|nr:uncharacterized protein LOC131269159 [Anopheles coustani]XP_058175646.1 uncharacterized protein LOC131290511 [Anopheles ziemanni]